MKYMKKYLCLRLEDLQLEPGEIAVRLTPYMIPGVYPYYIVTNYGRIYHIHTRQYMTLGDRKGYVSVCLSTIYGLLTILVHRLIKIVFNPIPDMQYYQVNHKDGNKLNNRLDNLEWCTHSYNMKHAYNTGLMQIGERHPTSKISDAQAIQICELLQTGNYTYQDICNIIGPPVSAPIVKSIYQRMNWAHISKDYYFPPHKRIRLFSDDEVHLFCKYFEDNPRPEYMSKNKYCTNVLAALNHSTEKRYVDLLTIIYNRKNYLDISQNYNF